MALDVERPVAGGQVRLDLRQLDRRAPDLVAAADLSELEPHLDDLLSADLRGRPRIRLLLAVLLGEADPTDARADDMAKAAWRSFQRAKDRDGLGLAAYVQGRIANARGDLESAADWWSRSREVSGNHAPVSEDNLVDVGLEAWARRELDTARRLGNESIELARARRNRADELRGYGLLGLLATYEGDLVEAERLADEAGVASPGWEDDEPELGLLFAVQGFVLAVRGEEAAASEAFDRGAACGGRSPQPTIRSIALALKAELLSHLRPEESLREAWSASAMLTGAPSWCRRLAVRAVAMSAAETGDTEAADAALETLLAEDLDDYERGRALLSQATYRRYETSAADDDARRAELGEAVALLKGSGARYWAARAALELAALDEEHAQDWRDEAASLSNGDQAFVRLLRTDHVLGVEAADGGSILLDGQRVQLLTRHAELTVYLLALAGPQGLSADELAERLWPEAPAHRRRPRLRTCLWQIRRELGPEHWRLRRDTSRVYLESEGVELDRPALQDLVEHFEL